MAEKDFGQEKYDALADELQALRAFLNAILNSDYYGIANYEPIRQQGEVVDFRIKFTNAEIPGNFGKKIEDVLHKTCREVYPGIFENGVFEKLKATLESGQPDMYEISVPVGRKIMWLTAAIEKVNDSVTVTSKNITSEKEAALHLEKMNELLAKKEALLEQKNIRLQSQNDELASFNYIASHDLQEPLRKIRMFASRIVESEDGNLKDSSLAHFENINSTAERMQNLINDLLSYSAMDSENLTMEKTDLNVILHDVVASVEDMVAIRNATIETIVLPTINGIPQQLQQLFSNIIINALKYSKKDINAEIKMTCEQVALKGRKFYKIAISDNGIGFEPQYKDRIFEVFQRLHGKKEYGGTGVGLAICKKIMQFHNGFISADAKPDEGAVFSLFFPIV